MTGCAGAKRTQACTLTCMSPPPLVLHPCLDLYGLRALSNSDRAPVFLFVLCTRLFRDWALPGHLSRPGGCTKVLVDLSRLDGCTFGFGSGSRPLVFFRWRPDLMTPILNKWTCPWQVNVKVWAGSGSGLLVFIELEPSRPSSLEPGESVQT